MKPVSVRELRNQGGMVLDRVEGGETVTVTRDGEPVAELRPLPRRATAIAELIARRRCLPIVDPAKLRADIDDVLESAL